WPTSSFSRTATVLQARLKLGASHGSTVIPRGKRSRSKAERTTGRPKSERRNSNVNPLHRSKQPSRPGELHTDTHRPPAPSIRRCSEHRRDSVGQQRSWLGQNSQGLWLTDDLDDGIGTARRISSQRGSGRF